jgi:streptogramin lyase
LLPMARYALVFLAVAVLAACGGGTPVTSGTPTPAPTATPAVTSQYPIPTASSVPMGITLGSDGNLWFTESASSKIGTLTSNGKITEEVTPTSKADPVGIASGPGPALNVWFTETKLARVGQITTTGPPFVEYILPDRAARPMELTLGADGNMWCTDPGTNSIWRIQQIKPKPHVRFTQFRLTGNAQPFAITTGPDSALWFTEPGTNSIGRLPVSGRPLQEYKLTPSDAQPTGITNALDGQLWFVEAKAQQIVSMATNGSITATYPLTGSVSPDSLLQGIDSNFYFTDPGLNKIGQFMIRSHRVNLYRVPTANSEPTAFTLGTDNQIYLVETAGNKLAQFRYFNI